MGWWNTHWDDLEPETVEHIKSQPTLTGTSVTQYRCGCEESAKDQFILHLCQWHEGFDEGVVVGRNTAL